MSLKEQSLKQSISHKHGKNYSLVNSGKFEDLPQYKLKHPRFENPVSGKLFLKDHLNATGMQLSLGVLPPGFALPFTHMHKQNEELYIFVGGKGQMQVDGEELDVEEGSVVRVATAGDRTLRNNSDGPLYYLVVQAKENSLSQDTFDDGIPGTNPPEWAD